MSERLSAVGAGGIALDQAALFDPEWPRAGSDVAGVCIKVVFVVWFVN